MAKTAILGVNSAGYNTSSSLIVDGQVMFAAEEERLIREKRTRRFPIQGIKQGLQTANLDFNDLDAVAVGWNPGTNLEAFNLPQSQRARYLGEIFYNVPNYLMTLKQDNSSKLSQHILDFQDGSQSKVYYVMHHLSHASSFFFSPFERAAVMAIDAFGEKHCVVFVIGEGNKMKVLWSQEFPHSLGSFYGTMTEFLGFQPDSDEWKVMGASPYGDPNRYYDKMRSLFFFKDDDGFELDLRYFNHYQFHRPKMYNPKLSELLGLQPNERDKPLTQEYYDLSAAVQRVTEDVYFHLINQLYRMTGVDNLVLSGGVVYNSVANGKVHANTPFTEIFIPPVPDDSGGALGAAYYVYHQIMDKPREYVMTSNFFGPGFSNQDIQSLLTKLKISHQVLDDPAKVGAELVAQGNIIGWFQGRLEFGDRALGNRSILADPRDATMKDKVNDTVKYREPFRPFAPSILLEHIDEYFEDAVPAPFMEKVLPIRKEKHEVIPAVTHVDGSGRLQSVTKDQNELYWNLINEFYKLTGVPVVLNTSFNLKGEAIVCGPQDAIRTFYTSGLDALIMGNCLLRKKI